MYNSKSVVLERQKKRRKKNEFKHVTYSTYERDKALHDIV
jgi:hypothetical protein